MSIVTTPRAEARTDREFVHIGVGRMQHRPARPHRDHGQSVRHVLGGQRRAFQRIKRDVDFGAGAGAHFFADIQHRGFVAFAFADDDNAVDVELVELGPHGVDRSLVGGLLVAAPDQAGRRQGPRLR